MKIKRAILILSILVIAGAAIYGITVRSVHAQDPGDQSPVSDSSKLDDILQKQKTIMEDLASIKDDIRIIKIRITQAQ